MRHYLVSVHCCGPRWIVHVPAVGAWALGDSKRAIKLVARQLISSITGVGAAEFELDLIHGRAVATVDEFSSAAIFAQRWERNPAWPGQVSDPVAADDVVPVRRGL
ncbi:hypothetical protein AB0L57_14960 [Nocardia sp. NPDC052254]|uniref:hypothetical protein n=1 Tax=Nocardia sp. NPDC052254 TaxID=3155681 RepID=UPI003427E943